MSTERVLFVGGALGLAVSSAVLTLMWYGVSGILYVDHIYLGHLFWPSSVMLLASWRTTMHGIMVTLLSVAINCLLYMAISYCLRGAVGLVARS